MSLANKGAIYMNFKINWEQIEIVNCHLASGTTKKDYQKRIENLKEIEDILDQKNKQNL